MKKEKEEDEPIVVEETDAAGEEEKAIKIPLPEARKIGVCEIKVILCFVLFIGTLLVLVPLSAPPHTDEKKVASSILGGMGLFLMAFVIFSNKSTGLIKSMILPLVGMSEADERKKFLLEVIRMPESCNIYIRGSKINVDRSKVAIEDVEAYTVGDDLVVTFMFRDMESNRFCHLILDSISYEKYEAGTAKTRESAICEKLTETARTFNVFQ